MCGMIRIVKKFDQVLFSDNYQLMFGEVLFDWRDWRIKFLAISPFQLQTSYRTKITLVGGLVEETMLELNDHFNLLILLIKYSRMHTSFLTVGKIRNNASASQTCFESSQLLKRIKACDYKFLIISCSKKQVIFSLSLRLGNEISYSNGFLLIGFPKKGYSDQQFQDLLIAVKNKNRE